MAQTESQRYRVLGLTAGAVLGLGAPAGALLFRLSLLGDYSFQAAKHDFFQHSFFYFYTLYLTPFFFGALGYALGLLSDHLALRARSLDRSLKTMQDLAHRDDLTGLYNHRHLYDEISKEIERSRRYGHSVCGMMIDLDHFKEINDRYGHLAGDVALRECGKILKNHLRRVDIIGRYGGDEFLAILPSTDAATAAVVAERLRGSISRHLFHIFQHPVHLSVSVGLWAIDNPEKLTTENFIHKADKALFEAKHHGRNRVCTYMDDIAHDASSS